MSARDRDTAKTFIYAWLLGAGTAKIAQILWLFAERGKICIGGFYLSVSWVKVP